jgi:microsomal dipeptidase-like Zn-dependent dipeptidase
MMAGGDWLRDFDATSYPLLTQALLARGLSENSVRKIVGENSRRLLDKAKL